MWTNTLVDGSPMYASAELEKKVTIVPELMQRVELDRDNNWDLIKGFCKMAGGRDDTWYATNIEIVDYMSAADRLLFSASGNFAYNPSALSVWISVDGRMVELKGGAQTQI